MCERERGREGGRNHVRNGRKKGACRSLGIRVCSSFSLSLSHSHSLSLPLSMDERLGERKGERDKNLKSGDG